MTGKGADVGVVSGSFWGAEVEGVGFSGVDDGDDVEDFSKLGDVVFFAGFGIVEHLEGSVSDLLGGTGFEDDEVVRHDVGVL